MKRTLHGFAVLALILSPGALAQEPASDPLQIPAIKTFLSAGFGAAHEKAPAQTEQFGRLVGVWKVEAELPASNDGWTATAPGIWVWKYTLDGFAISDLWFQSADRLPPYAAGLGRDYVLNSNRLYDVANKKWRITWMANGAGRVLSPDFGTFTAVAEEDQIVMTSPKSPMFGLQRAVFHDITQDSFRWKSEYSTDDGKTWNPGMRMKAQRYVR